MRAAPLDSASVSRSDSSSTSTPRERSSVGERVVLRLRLGHPWQPVEQQRVVVARREALQLGAGTVQDDHPQRPDLGVHPKRGYRTQLSTVSRRPLSRARHLNYGLGMDIHELTPGEMADRSGVAVSALHFYERQGLIASRRTTGNQRRYAREMPAPRRLHPHVADGWASRSPGSGKRWRRCPPTASRPARTGPGSPQAGARTSTTGSCTCSGFATTSPAASAAAA